MKTIWKGIDWLARAVIDVIPKHLEPITAKLRKIGVYVEIEDDTDNVSHFCGLFGTQ